MTKEEFIDMVAPKSSMSQDEMAKVISEESADSAFSEAEKSARMMGDNSGICGMISSEEVRASSNPINPAVYYGGATIKQRDMNKVKKGHQEP